MYITLATAKHHLNVEFDDDDLYIMELVDAAEAYVEQYLGYPLSYYAEDGALNSAIQSACLLLVGTLYMSRESISFSTITENPAYRMLLEPYRNENKPF